MNNNFNIITGYFQGNNKMYSGFDKDKFFDIWYKNTRKFTNNKIYVINIDGNFEKEKYDNTEFINLEHNLGHIGDLIKTKKFHLSGWSLSILIGLLICYNNNCDFIYKEQDCLFFGDINNVYEQLENKQCKSLMSILHSDWVEQSFFIVKHDFILTFVIEWLNIPSADYDLLTELKHHFLYEKYPNDIKEFDFGYGRKRPFNIEDKNFFIQQINVDEMELLKKTNLI
jgi:hypothetical protein